MIIIFTEMNERSVRIYILYEQCFTPSRMSEYHIWVITFLFELRQHSKDLLTIQYRFFIFMQIRMNII
ncbi:hypothetical protein VC34_08635 [Pseudomonas fluorescens]|uniref:Uncharacterized protein n=1 Tax=Pseudomonas fluorescens TaxID=294 RepID=A0A0F4TNM1_PSEFL|nr:hypothetical protein VC34_08635 [Pseudomonas fluorescens]